MTESTEAGTALVAPTDEAIQSLRSKGAAMVAFAKERNELARTIQGIQWGTVSGADLSIQTRTMLAQYCVITRANPLTQVDLLGGKPYLNANYWIERIVNDPAYVDHLQREITEGAENALRAIAADHRAVIEMIRDEDAKASNLAKALELEAEASDIAVARANFNPPKGVTSVVETQIRRFMNQAPLEAIRAGDIPMDEAEKWIITVSECNWAGGQDKDPVGNKHPEKTARTRSMRRCATRAFSAWAARYDEQITKAEEALEAEWEFVQDEPAQPTTGPQAALASGEPEAGDVAEARALPVRGQEDSPDGHCAACGGEGCPQCSAAHQEEEEEIPEAEVVEEAPAFDPSDSRKRLFATLRDCGITEKKRKAWQKKNKLPESTKDWGKDEYDRAIASLVDPLKAKVDEGCETLRLDLGDLSLQVINKAMPDFAKDYNALIAALEIRLDSSGDGEDEEDAGL